MKKSRRKAKPAAILQVDNILMLFMLVLLLHAGIMLFTDDAATQERTTIDIIVRTSAAAIFGYFLSAPPTAANTGTPNSSQAVPTLPAPGSSADAPKNAIGFQADAAAAPLASGSARATAAPPCRPARLLFLSAVCALCLFFLLLLRHCDTIPSSAVATISQFRDFIAASIGFLISCGKSRGG